LGTLLDPLADKALLISAYLSLAFVPAVPESMSLPIWITLLIISRDCMLFFGALVIVILNGRFEPRTNYAGKATTFMQMILVLFILWGFPVWRIDVLVYSTGAMTLLSCLLYLRVGALMLSDNANPLNGGAT